MSFKHHLLFICSPSWGHCRPSVPISFQVIKERSDILVTYFVIGHFKEKMDKEVARYCTGENSALKDNIRIIKLANFEGGEFEFWDLIIELAPAFFQRLWVCEPITCLSGQVYPSAPKPSICIVDCTLARLGASLINEKKSKVWFWCPPSTSAITSTLAPPDLGGFGNILQNAEKLAEEKKISVEEAINKLLTPTGKVKTFAGLPPVYDYELIGDHTIPGANERKIHGVGTIMTHFFQSDALLMVSTPIIEEGTISAIKEWLDTLGKATYALGPCVLSGQVESGQELEESSRGQEIIAFLDKIYVTHGKNSLLYMSFGTSVFPEEETPWQLINIILDMKIPLIFAMPHANTYEKTLTSDLRSRLESSELALVAKWIPQQTVLKHPATGFFFTHGGQGSTTESLVFGVPMIVWPLQGDQTYNALNLTANLKVAYQLLEVRVGPYGLKPLYRGYQPKGTKEAIDAEFRQVLKDAFGPDGEVKRSIALDLSKKLRETWEEGGEAMIELRRMLHENFS